MGARSDPESVGHPGTPGTDAGIYVDSSALAIPYVPEPESDRLDGFLRDRAALVISQLAITGVLSAVARGKREGVLTADQALAERLLLSTDSHPLRTSDALHVALALSGPVSHIVLSSPTGSSDFCFAVTWRPRKRTLGTGVPPLTRPVAVQ